MTAPPLTPEAAKQAAAADKAALRSALAAASGNVRKVAALLGVHPTTLHRRIGALGLRAWLTATYPRSKRQPHK